MADLLLHMTLIDLARGGPGRAQRMTGEFGRTLVLTEVAMQAGGQGRGLDKAGALSSRRSSPTSLPLAVTRRDKLAIAAAMEASAALSGPFKAETYARMSGLVVGNKGNTGRTNRNL